LRAANILIRKSTGGVAISPFVNGGKIRHIQSQNFPQQLQQLFKRVARKTLLPETLRLQVVGLATTRLGVVSQGKLVEARQEYLAGQLQRKGLPRELADAVIMRMMLLGEAVTVSLAGVDLSRDRTGFDVFCALIREAQSHQLKNREQLEQLAYELLSGGFVLCATL